MLLYKYFRYSGVERLKQSVEGKIWCCNLEKLNDPFEGAFYFDKEKYANYYISRYCKKKGLPIEAGKRAFDSMLANGQIDFWGSLLEIRERFRKVIFNISFSAVPNSLLMWSHYSDEHRGYVIEYEFPDDYEMLIDMGLEGSHGYGLRKVDYTTDMYLLHDIDGLSEIPLVLLKKSPDWSYEREYRTVFIDVDNVAANGLLKSISAKFIKSIIIGMRSSLTPGEIDEISPGIVIKMAKENYGHYSLEIKDRI